MDQILKDTSKKFAPYNEPIMEREQRSHSALYIEQVDEDPSIANNQYVVEKKTVL